MNNHEHIQAAFRHAQQIADNLPPEYRTQVGLGRYREQNMTVRAPTSIVFVYRCPNCKTYLVRDMADCQESVPPPCREQEDCGELKHVATLNAKINIQSLLNGTATVGWLRSKCR